MGTYLKYLALSLGITLGAGLFVALGNWLFGTAGALIAFGLAVGGGIWYYNYNYQKNKCPLQK